MADLPHWVGAATVDEDELAEHAAEEAAARAAGLATKQDAATAATDAEVAAAVAVKQDAATAATDAELAAFIAIAATDAELAAGLATRLPVTRAAVTEAGSAAVNKTAIDNALAEADAPRGGIVLIPEGAFETNGGHDVPIGVEVWGLRRGTSELINRGATYTFRQMDETSGGAGAGVRHLSIKGSTGSLPPVAGGKGIELSNGLAANVEDVWIDGFTEVGSIGLYFHIVDGDTPWVEQARVENVAVINCRQLVRFDKDPAAGGTSYGYNRLRGMQLMVFDDQIAISVGTGTLYNAWIEGTLHYGGDDAVGLDIEANGEVWQGIKLDIRGEMLAAHTGCTRIRSAGKLDAAGKFYIANGQPPDDHDAGVWNFIEDDPTHAELQQTGDLTIEAATTMTIPSRGGFFTVTPSDPPSGIQALGGIHWEGRVITLKFNDAIVVTNTFNLRLAGGFNATADDTLTLVQRSGTWYEIARSVN